MRSNTNEDSRPSIARVAKGKRPRYFSDPATDKLLNIVMALVGELSVTRERLDSLERLLENSGVLSRDLVEGFKPDEAAKQDRKARRSEYLDRVLRTVQMELEEAVGNDMPKSRLDVLKHL